MRIDGQGHGMLFEKEKIVVFFANSDLYERILKKWIFDHHDIINSIFLVVK